MSENSNIYPRVEMLTPKSSTEGRPGGRDRADPQVSEPEEQIELEKRIW